jgi:23S rRNA (guanosine2251-2'-O)-methyltransferase
VASHHQRNDPSSPRGRARRPGRADAGSTSARRSDEARGEWLWGWHTVLGALENPARPAPRRLLASPERCRQLRQRFAAAFPIEEADGQQIASLLPAGAVHQGVALRTPPLEPVDLETLGAPTEGVLLMLDQVTDPQNIGAIFRSAAAFGARGVVLQDRHAPLLAGALAKAAAGAVDRVPHAREVNLSRALERLEALGWRAVALAGDGEASLADVLDGGPVVLVLGAEGEGVRRLVREHCDVVAGIPMPGGFESLNVSAAAAVALYEASRPR